MGKFATWVTLFSSLILSWKTAVNALVFDKCYNNSCYVLTPAVSSYIMGIEACLDDCALLASIHSQGEQNYLKTILQSNTKYWIGLNLSLYQRNVWGDGTPLDFTASSFVVPDLQKDCSYIRGSDWQTSTCEGGGTPALCRQRGPPCNEPGPPAANTSVHAIRPTGYTRCYPNGTQLMYACDPTCSMQGGYTERVRTCSNGTWVGPPVDQLACSCPVLCPDPPFVNLTLRTPEPEDVGHIFMVNSTVIYSCVSGYVWSDAPNEINRTLECSPSGEWSVPAVSPLCVASCPPPPLIYAANIVVISENKTDILVNEDSTLLNETDTLLNGTEHVFMAGNIVHYSCWPGLLLQGELSSEIEISCQDDGTWNASSLPGICEAPSCFLPEDAGQAVSLFYVTGNYSTFLNDTSITSDDFERISGNGTVWYPWDVIGRRCFNGTAFPSSRRPRVLFTCNDLGLWVGTSDEMISGDVFSDCVATCPDPPVVTNAYIQFSFTGENYVNINGTWIETNTSIAARLTFLPGDFVTYLCETGTAFPVSRERYFNMDCLEEGVWDSSPHSQCMSVCPRPLHITGASLALKYIDGSYEPVVASSSELIYFPGDTVMYTCEAGKSFRHLGAESEVIYCNGDRTWNDTDLPRHCTSLCQEPPVLNNTDMTIESLYEGLYFPGDHVVYDCSEDMVFHHSGLRETVAQCLDNGEWSDQLGPSNNRCVAICPPPPPISFGRLAGSPRNESVSSTATVEATPYPGPPATTYTGGFSHTRIITDRHDTTVGRRPPSTVSSTRTSSATRPNLISISSPPYLPITDHVSTTAIGPPIAVPSSPTISTTHAMSSHSSVPQLEITNHLNTTTTAIGPTSTDATCISSTNSTTAPLLSNTTAVPCMQITDHITETMLTIGPSLTEPHQSSTAPQGPLSPPAQFVPLAADQPPAARERVYKYGDVVKYVCNAGYKFPGGLNTSMLKCLSNGTWNLDQISTCVPVPSVSGSGTSTAGTSPNTNLVTRNLSNGPNIVGVTSSNPMTTSLPIRTETQSSLTTSSTTVALTSVTPVVPTALVTVEVYTSGLTTAVTTSSRTTPLSTTNTPMPTTEHLERTSTGIPETTTTDVQCEQIQQVNNARPNVNVNATVYPGTLVEFSCNRYYMFPDRTRAKEISCTENGSWTEQLPHCEVIEDCSNMLNVTNAVVDRINFTVGATVRYACVNNLTFPDGSHTRRTVCTPDGYWWPVIPGCAEYIMGLKRRRKHDFVPLEAPGAVAVGSFGMLIMLGIIIGIVALDVPTLVLQMRRMRRNIRSFLKHHQGAGRWPARSC
ncbi:uncharacterized protein LOC106159876 [Lingula anatina]|uniref:Uncharacterized protein LOC106159876 n=1 Tax=Lingula anatina TaxID=7574 RepID=A0A1S3I1Q6_LINAN|nr:uncharacterized protein LOC106159876 [Lingula anatina]|eukprot:XP_013391761.1 uncharacterized protein LOC106159876 [Lingula anatina]